MHSSHHLKSHVYTVILCVVHFSGLITSQPDALTVAWGMWEHTKAITDYIIIRSTRYIGNDVIIMSTSWAQKPVCFVLNQGFPWRKWACPILKQLVYLDTTVCVMQGFYSIFVWWILPPSKNLLKETLKMNRKWCLSPWMLLSLSVHSFVSILLHCQLCFKLVDFEPSE